MINNPYSIPDATYLSLPIWYFNHYKENS